MSDIAFDAVSNSLVAAASAPLSHTVANQPNRMLLVAVDGSNRASAVSYAGVAMTLFGSIANGTTGRTIDLWYQFAPTVGANNITFTGGTSQIQIGLSYYNVKQAAFPDGSHSTNGVFSATHSETVTTVADGCWVIAWTDTDGTNSTAGANTTNRTSSTTFAFEAFDSNGPKTPPGARTLNFVGGGGLSVNWASIAVAIAPFRPPSMLAVF